MKSLKSKTGRNESGKGMNATRVVIITGLSGSGKTVALRAVEDSDFFCVDNLPVSLIASLVARVSKDAGINKIAVGVDIREKEFLDSIGKTIRYLRKKQNVDILFLEAEAEVLARRFKETRRPHPLGGNLEEAIESERKSLSSIRENADRIIDTSSFSPHQLRRLVSSLYIPRSISKDITVSLLSFGFKYGVPPNLDILLDVRFLPNPFFVPALKNLTGIDRRVAKYVLRHAESKEFIEKIKNLLDFLIPLYIKEGKQYLSIAFGCTGGRHRSPAIVEEIKKSINKNNIGLNIIHRDMS